MFIFKDTRKRGPAYPDSTPYTAPDGTRHARYPMELLEEIPEPAAPEDYSDALYYRTEQDDAPYVVYTRKSDEMLAKDAQTRINTASLAYLSATDWYVIRQLERGIAVPQSVLEARQSARDAIVEQPTSAL